ncbi:MAG: sensor histidine kinase [Pseudonocardia sp.]|jgi:signal transduction histidine kinase
MTALRDWTATVRIAAPLFPPTSTNDAAPVPDSTALKVGAERQRIAMALHDEVAPLLFGMASRVRRTLTEESADPDAQRLLDTMRTLADELRAAQDQLRSVIRGAAPVAPAEALATATQRDVEAFTERTGVPAHLVVRGPAAVLPATVERVALNCLRQAMVNVERHADARVAVVTLDYQPDRLRLVVQDDGLGLPVGFEPRGVPLDGHHWGFTSMAEQVERQGGSVLLRKVDEGGTQLCVDLPLRR